MNETRASLRRAQVAHCPECGKEIEYVREMNAWDCGPETVGGHGYWSRNDVAWYSPLRKDEGR